MVLESIQLQLRKISQGVRWRLGMPVAAAELEIGTDESVAAFYRSRLTGCDFLEDPTHYEHPRAHWILQHARGGTLLEIGCGNGGMTRLLSPQVDRLIALDVSTPSIEAVRALGLPNVEADEALVEHYHPAVRFDWIVMSEVIEHLRKPADIIEKCLQMLAPGGALLLTTPNGHWESNEHLHEFSLASFAALLTVTAAETVQVEYIRDAEGRRRWLAGKAAMPLLPPTPDSFNDRREIVKLRKAQH